MNADDELRQYLSNSPDVAALNMPEAVPVRKRETAVAKRHKYGAKKIEVDGHVFPSKKEGRRYLQLKAMQQAGEISGLELQPEFELLPAFRDVTGERHRAIKYRADFKYRDSSGVIIIEDTKGYQTAVFKIKRKLFCHRYDYELRLT